MSRQMRRIDFLRRLVAILTGRTLSREAFPVTESQGLVEQDVGKFFLVTGIGHCGTAWLATVLDRPDDNMICYHEHKNAVTGLNWKASLMHEFEHGLDGRFEAYWQFMRQQMRRFQVVGDSNA